MELELPVECHFCKNKYFNNVQHSNCNTKLPAWIHHSQGIRNALGIIPTHNLLMYVSCRRFKTGWRANIVLNRASRY